MSLAMVIDPRRRSGWFMRLITYVRGCCCMKGKLFFKNGEFGKKRKLRKQTEFGAKRSS